MLLTIGSPAGNPTRYVELVSQGLKVTTQIQPNTDIKLFPSTKLKVRSLCLVIKYLRLSLSVCCIRNCEVPKGLEFPNQTEVATVKAGAVKLIRNGLMAWGRHLCS